MIKRVVCQTDDDDDDDDISITAADCTVTVPYKIWNTLHKIYCINILYKYTVQCINILYKFTV